MGRKEKDRRQKTEDFTVHGQSDSPTNPLNGIPHPVAQEDVLKAIWEAEKGAVSDILDLIPDPKPAYTTVATVIKVLERKGYVAHETYGKTHVYHALIQKKDYANQVVGEAFAGLLNSSLNQLVSPFILNRDISISELEELKKILESEIEKQRKQDGNN